MRSVWQVGGRAHSPTRAWATPQVGATRASAAGLFGGAAEIDVSSGRYGLPRVCMLIWQFEAWVPAFSFTYCCAVM